MTATKETECIKDDRGRNLHREFVGMLFALAIAQVAIQASVVLNSEIAIQDSIPSFLHLILGTIIIVTSWVGWGWSDHHSSNIRNPFTADFVELLLDLWLVAIYFFIVMGVEMPTKGSPTVITPTMANELFWTMIMFCTYFAWDLINKFGKKTVDERSLLIQRGWASGTSCFICLAVWWYLSDLPQTYIVVVSVDVTLLGLVFLFRAMKLKNLSALKKKDLIRIVICGLVVALGILSALFLQDAWKKLTITKPSHSNSAPTGSASPAH